MIRVWDRRTGRKLARPVPVAWLDLFPYLSRTPLQKRVDRKNARAAGRVEKKGAPDA